MTLYVRFVRKESSEAAASVLMSTEAVPLLDYVPRQPEIEVFRTAGRREGSFPVDHRTANVTETLRLAIACDHTGYLRTLQQLFYIALEWAEQFRKDQYIAIEVRDTSRHTDWYSARVYFGRVTLTESHGKVVEVEVERDPYWRGPERIVRLSNTSTETFASSVTIYNHDSGWEGRDNWVTIAEDIGGDVPADTVIRLQNTSTTGDIGVVHVGWQDRPQLLTLEGENGGATVYAADGYSNGALGRGTAFEWTLPQSNIVDYTGMFRVLANGVLVGDWQCRLGYEITPLQRGATVTGGAGWTDMGVFSLPPGGYVHPTRYPISVWLSGDTDSSLDFVLFMPLQQYRKWRYIAYNAAEGDCTEDNGILDELVFLWNGLKMPVVNGYGDRIRLHPARMLPGDKRQMLVFAMQASTGGAPADRTAVVQVRVAERWGIVP
jgi:hypothetical protein